MRRRNEPEFLDVAYRLFLVMPVWVGPVVAAVMFGVIWALPWVIRDTGPVKMFGPICHMLACVVGGLLMVAWAVALVGKLSNRSLFRRHAEMPRETIPELSWEEFERLVAEAYRRQGYLAEVVGSASGDGGVDIELRGRGEWVLVQCKHWKAYRVGVGAVRELLGVVVSERANRGVLVTSGRFTAEAVRFAKRNGNLELVDGAALARLMASVSSQHVVRAR